MAIGYRKEFTGTFPRARFRPKKYTWVINALGYMAYAVAVVFVVFGSLIIYFPEIRSVYFNWGIASYIGALIMYFMGSRLIRRFGVRYFNLSENTLSLTSPLTVPLVIRRDEIVHLRVEYPNPSLSILPLVSPVVIIGTFDRLYRFRSSRWQDEEVLLGILDELSKELQDDFAEYYHKSKSTLTSFFIRMSQDTPGIIGLTLITIYVFLALWGGIAMLINGINSGNPYVLFLRNPEFGNGELPGYNWATARFHPPNQDFWFGTDFVGRDVFSRMVYGTFFTFLIAMTGSVVSVGIVIFLGLTSAMYDTWYDTMVTRVADALMTFPPFIPLILISTIATPVRTAFPGGYFFAVFIGMSFFTWPLGVRIIRSEVLELMTTEYVLAAKQIGASQNYIILRHLLPKIVPTILILFTYTFADIILGTTLLGFIGMDSESTLTWGSDLAKAVKFSDDMLSVWWTVVYPTIWIFLLVFGLHLFSDSIRDVLDPKLRGGEKAVSLEFKEELEKLKEQEKIRDKELAARRRSGL